MSSESNGRKSDGAGAEAPGSATNGPRSNARVASAWGAARDALAAVRNLDALLRSPVVPAKTILDLVPELQATAGVLREAFERSLAGDEATAAVGAHGRLRVGGLDRVLEALVAEPGARTELAARVGPLADELEASIELMVLLDRAAAPVPTEITVDLVARELGRMSGSARGREVIVQFDEARPDRDIHADPYVLGPLLALLVACMQSAGVDPLVLRARSAPLAHFLVEAAVPADAALPTLTVRVMPWIAPSESATRHVAGQIRATLEIDRAPGTAHASIAVAAD
jgi:hypothetical protein